jgi:hypothetical protein
MSERLRKQTMTIVETDWRKNEQSFGDSWGMLLRWCSWQAGRVTAMTTQRNVIQLNSPSSAGAAFSCTQPCLPDPVRPRKTNPYTETALTNILAFEVDIRLLWTEKHGYIMSGSQRKLGCITWCMRAGNLHQNAVKARLLKLNCCKSSYVSFG